MKDVYDLKGKPRKNHYADSIQKHGYSVSIHYENIENEEDFRINTLMELLMDPKLNSLHLIKKGNHSVENMNDSM